MKTVKYAVIVLPVVVILITAGLLVGNLGKTYGAEIANYALPSAETTFSETYAFNEITDNNGLDDINHE
ncbi:hypothetical protein ACFLS8_03780 [Chloroflexota bacterium]